MITKYFSILCVLLVSTLTAAGFAPTIHVCYVMDTKERELVGAIQKMNEEVETQVYQIQKALNGRVERHYVTGEKYNSEQLYLTVEKMDIKPFNDIIILAVLSHAKNDGQNRYPVLRFSESDKRSFLDIADLFLAKQPAYFLSLVNACNDSVTSKPLTTPYQFAIQPLKTGNASLEKYQQLFKKTNHTVAVTYLSAQACSATFVDELGGESFSALIASLKSWMAKEQTGTPTWEKVLFTAQTLTIQRTQNGALECPYLEIVHVRLHEGKIQREGQGLELCK